MKASQLELRPLADLTLTHAHSVYRGTKERLYNCAQREIILSPVEG